MTTHLPSTPDEILKTATIDPEFAQAWEETPFPAGSEYTVDIIKQLAAAGLPNRQKALANSRPSTITESEHYLTTRDGWKSRTIVCHPKSTSSSPSPLIILLFGGGHTVGSPESEIEIARDLALAHNAVIVLPSYRLAPEHPFPYSANDSWDCLQAIAAEASNLPTSTLLPSFTSPSSGFILGGTSAGCSLTAICTHLARDNHLSPPLTGQFLCAGSYMSPYHVLPKYQPYYLSREQNKHAPILDMDLHKLFRAAHKPDYSSTLAFSFDQKNPKDKPGEVKEGHMGLPPAYFQVCGLDMGRDDGLIYERVLREECGIPTRLDLYPGMPHCWWGMFPKLKMTQRRTKETVEGIGWLLAVGKQKK